MEEQGDIEVRRKLRSAFLAFASLVLALVAGVLIIGRSALGWFTTNDRTGGGLSLAVKYENMTFADEFTVDYGFSDTRVTRVYRRYANTEHFYLYDTVAGEFILDEEGSYQSFTVTQLLPTQYVDIHLTLLCDTAMAGSGYSLSFTGIDDVGADPGAPIGIFPVKDDLGVEHLHSILGLYRVYTVTGDTAAECGGEGKGYLAYYNGIDTDDTKADTFDIVTDGEFGKAVTDGKVQAEVTVRLVMDVTQYRQLGHAQTNQLSERIFTIDQLVLGPAKE